MAGIIINIEADKARWKRVTDARFNTFKKVVDADARKVASTLRSEVPSIVRAGLNRPENPARHPDSGLAEAIQTSIAPFQKGFGGTNIGVRVTDVQTLNRMAIYWRVIELGGTETGHFSKVQNVRLFGFGEQPGLGATRRGTAPSVALAGSQPDALATRGSGGQIKVPIAPHKYLEKVSVRAVSLFDREVAKRVNTILGG